MLCAVRADKEGIDLVMELREGFPEEVRVDLLLKKCESSFEHGGVGVEE